MNIQNYDNRNKLLKTEAEFNNVLVCLQKATENSSNFNRKDTKELVTKVCDAVKDAALAALDISWNSEEDSNEGSHTMGSLGYQPLYQDIYNGEAVPSRPASQTGKSSYTVRLSPLLTSLASSFVFIHSSS